MHKEGKHAGQLLPKSKRMRKLQDQKANSIADMAAVLAMQARPPTKELIERAKFLVRTDGRPPAKYGFGSRRGHNVFEFQGRIDGTSVWWADMLDAEYAATWPEEVVHGKLAVNRGTAVWPPPEELASREHEVQVKGSEEEAHQMAVLKVKEERDALLRRRDEVAIKEKIKDAEKRAVETSTVEEESEEPKPSIASKAGQKMTLTFASPKRAWLSAFGINSGPVDQQSPPPT